MTTYVSFFWMLLLLPLFSFVEWSIVCKTFWEFFMWLLKVFETLLLLLNFLCEENFVVKVYFRLIETLSVSWLFSIKKFWRWSLLFKLEWIYLLFCWLVGLLLKFDVDFLPLNLFSYIFWRLLTLCCWEVFDDLSLWYF